MSERKRGPLRATDKRRTYGHQHPRIEEGQGQGKPIAHLFNDRRKPGHSLGKGKRAV